MNTNYAIRGFSSASATSLTFDRRDLISGAFASATTAAMGSKLASAEATLHRIDFHHHLSPPALLEALRRRGRSNPPLFNWSLEKSLEEMDKGAVAISILSVGSPSLPYIEDKEEARHVARESNDYTARVVAGHTARFGMLACLPLPHVEESLREIEYAYDTLQADGICLNSSFGDKWLGHPSFVSIMDELNRRRAVVHVHPGSTECCRDLAPVAQFSDSVIEYGTDTSRTIASILFSGTSLRCSDIHFVFAHGGGTMPYLIQRFASVGAGANSRFSRFTPQVVLSELKRFYYDTAIIADPTPLAALATLVPATQIVFGSDYPFRTPAATAAGVDAFFDAEALKLVERDNAVRLLPRLGSL